MMKGMRVGAVLLLAVALLLVAACGAGGDGGTQSNTPPGTLEIGIEAEPPELDPNLSSAYVDRQVMASIYDRLVDIDENGKIVPMLAESYEVSDDGTVYTFKLRQGVQFHDGEPFDAEAVKFNLERYQEDSVRSTEIEPVESVEAVDDSTVQVTLERPFAPFLAVLTDRAGIMVSPKAVEEGGGRVCKKPVGTGPVGVAGRGAGRAARPQEAWRPGPVRVRRAGARGPHHRQEEPGLLAGRPAQARRDRLQRHRRRERPVPEPPERRARLDRLDPLRELQEPQGGRRVQGLPGAGPRLPRLLPQHPAAPLRQQGAAPGRLQPRRPRRHREGGLTQRRGHPGELAFLRAVLRLQRGDQIGR